MRDKCDRADHSTQIELDVLTDFIVDPIWKPTVPAGINIGKRRVSSPQILINGPVSKKLAIKFVRPATDDFSALHPATRIPSSLIDRIEPDRVVRVERISVGI